MWPQWFSLQAASRGSLLDRGLLQNYAVPLRALTLAREVGALPAIVRIIGCQPANIDTFGTPMSDTVAAAIGPAVDLVFEVINGLRNA